MENHITYDAFGNVTSETDETIDHIYAYTGRDRDEESDLQYNRARYYDPTVGRWISEDPIAFAAGDSNLARYVGNAATNFTDPSGLVGEESVTQEPLVEPMPSADPDKLMELLVNAGVIGGGRSDPLAKSEWMVLTPLTSSPDPVDPNELMDHLAGQGVVGDTDGGAAGDTSDWWHYVWHPMEMEPWLAYPTVVFGWGFIGIGFGGLAGIGAGAAAGAAVGGGATGSVVGGVVGSGVGSTVGGAVGSIGGGPIGGTIGSIGGGVSGGMGGAARGGIPATKPPTGRSPIRPLLKDPMDPGAGARGVEQLEDRIMRGVPW